MTARLLWLSGPAPEIIRVNPSRPNPYSNQATAASVA